LCIILWHAKNALNTIVKKCMGWMKLIHIV
jgi:hypothetical protein